MFNHFPFEIFHDYFETQQNRNAMSFGIQNNNPPLAFLTNLFSYTQALHSVILISLIFSFGKRTRKKQLWI